MKYEDFLNKKTHISGDFGFDPIWLPDCMFDFQRSLVEWATKKGRAALFADCGLGKTLMQLVWAENVCRKSNGKVLILTPLAVASQTVKEAEKFDIEAEQSRDGKHTKKIVVTNYEKLHLFNSSDFVGCVCDESSILKSLGELVRSEMLTRFFRQLDDKGQKKEMRMQEQAEKESNYYGKLSFRVAQSIGQWRLKHHAVNDFWRWVCSWSRACRKPSDLGFSDDGFNLPDLIERRHLIEPKTPADGYLFCLPAFGLGEEREERKRTINERCEFAAELVKDSPSSIMWCHTNAEGDLLEETTPDSKQVAGKHSDEQKEETYRAFQEGELKTLIIKPKIGAWGMNWQHCNKVVTFASHSYEQYYQSVRRCWRFGQNNPVTVDIIATIGEERVLENMKRKSKQADLMFEKVVNEMNNSLRIEKENKHKKEMELPTWL